MPSQSLITFLTSSKLISALTAGEIANQFTEEKLNKHDFLLQEGNLQTNIFSWKMISCGRLRMTRRDMMSPPNFYSLDQVVLKCHNF